VQNDPNIAILRWKHVVSTLFPTERLKQKPIFLKTAATKTFLG